MFGTSSVYLSRKLFIQGVRPGNKIRNIGDGRGSRRTNTLVLWGRSSPKQPRRFPFEYTNTLSDGAQSATSLLAKSSRQRPLFFSLCFWMEFRAPKLNSVVLARTNTNTFKKDEMLYFLSYPLNVDCDKKLAA